jgi:hypothetical protein
MKVKTKQTKIWAFLPYAITAVLALYSAYKLDDYKIIANGILGMSVFVLIARLYLTPAEHVDWLNNSGPYSRTARGFVGYFVLCLVFFLAIMQATNMVIWIVKLIASSI